jgi:glycosyltransferase involved in cell wall biosynthesis
MKKILILSFYYQPDLSAGSFRTTALVKSLNKTDLDLDIEVITTAPNRYSSFREKVEAFEVVDGVRIHRIVIPMHNSGMFDQSLAFISYYRQAIKIAKKSNYDLVFATSSRLFTAFLGARIARKKKVALYLDIRDIFVDTISGILSKALGILFVPWLNLIERYTFSTAKHINLVSEGFLRYFEEKKIDASFSFFTNGIDKEFDDITNIISYETPSEKKLTILYAGNIGGGQGLHKIIPALAGRLGEHANFLVIGDGGQKEKLKNSIASMGLDNVELRDPIGRKQLIDEYVKADVLFLHLNNNPAFEKVLPSKLFEYASFNKPIFAGLSGYSVDFINAEISDCAVFMPCDIDDAVQKFDRLNLVVEPRIGFIKKFRRETIMTMMAANILLVLKDDA